MRFSVLAVDYDGTIADDGRIAPDVRSAIEEVRSSGVITILVTGRILSDLRRLMGDFGLFDAIVAENGAVLTFPHTGRSSILCNPPPPIFVERPTSRLS